MAIKNQLTNSSIRKYLPSKVLSGFAQTIDSMESWLYDDGTGDPWWQGAGATPVKWTLTADVYSSTHSSHLTRSPNIYTGLDITPGMWIFSNADPKAVRVVEIISKTDASITCVVEDVDRYNTFTDSTGSGLGIFAPSSNLIFFELGDDGLPILNPLPANTDISIVSQVEARFRVFNPTVENRFFQINHGFQEGQVLKIDPSTGKFVHATSQDVYIAGTVLAVGPGPHYFYLSPSTKIINDLEPGLPGNVGDVIWLDPTTGDRTTTPDGSNAALYIKMTSEVPSFTIGETDNPQVYTGTSIKLNNALLTFTATEFVDTQGIIDAINVTIDGHGVTASLGSPSLKVPCSVSYPTATPATNIQFKLNGVLTVVQLPSVNFGTAGQVGWWDIIRSINEQTNLHHVYATFDPFSGSVTLENNFGTAIQFENIVPTVTNGEDKTVTDMIGVPLVSTPADATKLKLVRDDGGAIIISDVSGTFTTDVGIQSAENGALPLALVVDKSMSASSNYMVTDIAARDALPGLRSGDQVFVQSANSNNEWALFVKTNTTWTKIADEDSASTDANTLTVDVTFDSISPLLLGSLSPGSRVVDVSIVVDTAFDGTASLTIGSSDDSTLVMDNGNWDLGNVGSYETGTSYINGMNVEQQLFVFLTASSSTVGSAKVIVSYL